MRDDLDTSAFGTRAPSRFVARVIRSTRRRGEAWADKRLSFLLRRLALRTLDGPVDVDAFGAAFRLYPFTNICERRILFTPQYFDAEERALLVEHCRPGCVFVDVGANIGGYSLAVAAAAGPAVRILAVEPQPDIFARLTYNIAQNPFGTVKAVACALADREGELTLFIDAHNRGQSSITVVPNAADEAPSVRVPGRTLLGLLREERLERVDALKIDVEGAEDLVLAPFLAQAPAALHPGLVVMANLPGRWRIDLAALMERHGYRPVLRTRLNVAYARG